MQTRRHCSSRFGFLRVPWCPSWLMLFLIFAFATSHAQNRDWPVYGGASEGGHYSPLTQINKSNVKQLQVAWTYDTDETGGLQTSPLVVDGVLYGISSSQKIFAL